MGKASKRNKNGQQINNKQETNQAISTRLRSKSKQKGLYMKKSKVEVKRNILQQNMKNTQNLLIKLSQELMINLSQFQFRNYKSQGCLKNYEPQTQKIAIKQVFIGQKKQRMINLSQFQFRNYKSQGCLKNYEPQTQKIAIKQKKEEKSDTSISFMIQNEQSKSRSKKHNKETNIGPGIKLLKEDMLDGELGFNEPQIKLLKGDMLDGELDINIKQKYSRKRSPDKLFQQDKQKKKKNCKCPLFKFNGICICK